MLFVLIVILAMKYAKYIIKNDLINKYFNRKIESSEIKGGNSNAINNVSNLGNTSNFNPQLNQVLNEGVSQS
jgi:hypothetical protein